ncbi:MAG: sulfite reductase subunit beta [Actinophytocola sp.]|uniref:sulfite reductase subunit beta n=1 Tax=Actinophytocola sp. TaxID=1872138 RepID=UPI003C7893A8
MAARTHADRCPGVFRPWVAEDGAIVRLRVPGGRLSADALLRVVDAAERYGDGTVLLTKRANLQLRGIQPRAVGGVPLGLVDAIADAGLLPSRTHELVRNILVSPLTGLFGGRVDLRPVVHALDDALTADPSLASLGGRFLFVLDDGRGDVARRDLDLGLVAVDATRAQLRAGTAGWGPVVPVGRAAADLVDLAGEFIRVRGRGPGACWHVDELSDPAAVLRTGAPRDPATAVESGPTPPGRYLGSGGRPVEVLAVQDGLVRRALAERLSGAAGLVVTPWRTIVVEEPA